MIFPSLPLDEQPEHIQFFFEEVQFPFLYPELISKWIIDSLTEEKKAINSISYIFCNDSYLLQVNQEYLAHDTFTDVITFQYHESKEEPIEGDIFISTERIAENAVKFDTTFDIELQRVMIHGALHLAGYKDKSTKDKTLMTEKENYYLSKFKI
ncbi:MAG: rRNA maturation RNase YbeY [Saprospiraceae bacterium]|nr:rRNA maturation RNase YbeY [Saprospiraceae bacterium]